VLLQNIDDINQALHVPELHQVIIRKLLGKCASFY